MMYGFYGPGHAFLAGLMNLLGFLLIVALLFAVFRALSGARPWPPAGRGMRRGWLNAWTGRDPALDLARERLARSEITPEQFNDIRAALDAGAHHAPDAGPRWGHDAALETARLRLARGEIDREEYESIRRALDA